MTDFISWCTIAPVAPVGKQWAGVLQSYDDAAGVANLAASLPTAYANTDALAAVAERFGKGGVAKFLRNKLPTKTSARSGDLGEILATAYVQQVRGYVVGPSRLIQRDHQEWAMRGDDVLGARLDEQARLRITKAEAKSRATLGSATVKSAREGLARNDELPSPHSLTQFAERLLPTADGDVGEAVLRLQMSEGVRPDRVDHLMFLFTGSDPTTHVEADLTAYAGAVPQLAVTLRVVGHQEFIRQVYETAAAGGS
jgi:hypothetical protein